MFYTNVATVGNHVLLRGVDNSGKRFKSRVPYAPTLFVPSLSSQGMPLRTPSKYHTLDNVPVKPVPLASIREARDFVERYKGVKDFTIYGNQNYQYCYIGDEYPGELDYNKDDIVIANIDIEVDSRNGFPKPDIATETVVSITIKTNDDKTWIVGLKRLDKAIEPIGKVRYYCCEDEEHLLATFIEYWNEIEPDIVTGWNVQFFDIPYLINRITNVLGEKEAKRLSPWKMFSFRNAIIHGKVNQAVNLVGVSILDYMEMYKKFTYTQQESYRLDHIAHVETGERKLDYSEFANLHTLYDNDFQTFIEYNVRDVELVEKIDEKMKLIDMVLALAYSAKVNYQDVFTQVRMWDTMIYHHLRKKNIVIPAKRDGSKNDQYSGAYVKEPIAGMHKWIMSFDLNSLYPHLIMQWNISPETLIKARWVEDERYTGEFDLESMLDKSADTSIAVKKNATVAPSGEFFDKSKLGFLPEMLEELYTERVEYKKKMIEAQKNLEEVGKVNAVVEGKNYLHKKYTNDIARYNNIQLARKVQLNSAYGALGNQYFRFYDLRLAESITKSGKLAIRWIEKRINAYMNDLLKTENIDYVIASDTDSIYVSFESLVNWSYAAKIMSNNSIVNFLNKVSNNKIIPFIDKSYSDLAKYVNAYSQKMKMSREVIADKGIWTAKKRYILNVHDNEGVRYSTPKLKMMGIETVKSSTPAICRTHLTEAIKIMMDGTQDDIYEFIESFKKEFEKLPFEDVSFPRGVNGLQKYKSTTGLCIKHTPIHVRGSLLYNKMIREAGLDKKYLLIQEGDKIKFSYLKEPNIAKQSVIAILDKLPEELELMEYIDYDVQFQKAFLDPLSVILNAVGWNVEKKSTLEHLFS